MVIACYYCQKNIKIEGKKTKIIYIKTRSMFFWILFILFFPISLFFLLIPRNKELVYLCEDCSKLKL